MGKKLVLIVIDGLTAATFEAVADSPELPALAALAARGRYRRAVSTFPSLTPVCLSSLATGAHQDVHGIPHLVWYHREEQRIVEYGSSFGAIRAAGLARSLRDTAIDMTQRHLSERAVTVFESVEDAGLTPATVNFTCYRGRTLHRASVPGVSPVKGPRRFWFFNLFESDAAGAGFSVRNRSAGTVDGYATAVGRWLVTRDGFDLFVFYLSDYDFASHIYGPSEAHEALVRSDRAVGALLDAAGGVDEFLERYAVILCSDHGQTRVEEAARLEESFAGVDGVLVTASNRAGMVYRLPGCAEDERALALRLDGEASVDVVLFREGETAVARREGEELRFAPAAGGWRMEGDAAVLDHPNALERAWTALANPNAGEVLVSAAAGWEFSDLGGRNHQGGGSHGSLLAGDSEVPMLTVGVDAEPASITDVSPAALAHLGIAPPAYARPLARVA